jgi:hypothetical protein
MSTRQNAWLLRVAWLTLPLTSGDAAAAAIRAWGDAPRAVAAVLLWSLWAVVLTATMIPRPQSLTITRLATPLAFSVAVLVAISGHPTTAASALACAATFVCWAFASLPWWGCACAQGAAYGDEERFPLKVPPALFLGILPLALFAVGVGVALGPLLLAGGHWVLGAIVVVLGFPAAILTVRSVHVLARRWVVLVPAGLVVADPMTLADPVLFPRRRVEGLGPADPRKRPPPEALDLRLGAAYGSLALLLDADAEVFRRSGRTSRGVETHLLMFTPVLSRTVLEHAARRRLAVRS